MIELYKWYISGSDQKQLYLPVIKISTDKFGAGPGVIPGFIFFIVYAGQWRKSFISEDASIKSTALRPSLTSRRKLIISIFSDETIFPFGVIWP